MSTCFICRADGGKRCPNTGGSCGLCGSLCPGYVPEEAVPQDVPER